MAICDLLPEISEFTTDFSQQQTFFNDIQSVINALCENRPITIRKATQPNQADFDLAWKAAEIGNVLPIPITQEFIWYDTSRNEIGGLYRTVNDDRTNVSTGNISTSTALSLGFLRSTSASLTGSKIAYNQKFDTPSGTPFRDWIVVTDLRGNETFLRSTTGERHSPALYDDGTKVAFQTTEYVANLQIAKINVDGTGLTRLTTNAFSDRHPHWRGSNIVFQSTEFTSPSFQILTMTDAGAGRTRLTNNAFSDTRPQYSPDGSKITFLSNRSGDLQVWIMDSNGANQTQVSAVGGGLVSSVEFAPTYSPDGIWIYFGKYRIHPDGTNFETWFVPNTHVFDFSTIINPPRAWIEAFFPSVGNISTIPEPQCVAVLEGNQTVIGWQTVTNTINAYALEVDGFTSTGKIYQISQFVDPSGNIRLLKQVEFDGTLNSATLNSNELPTDIEHILIIVDGAGETNAVPNNMFLRFNGDSDANNYFSLYSRANNVTASRVEILTGASQGIVLLFPGTQSAQNSHGVYAIWLIDIADSTALKQAVYEGGFSQAAASAANSNEITGMGVWNSTEAIQSISLSLIGALGDFVSGSKISFYGFPKNVRFTQ
jgi:hypothetical protein